MAAGVTRGVETGWQATVIVCGKCSRKVGGGFGEKGHTSLAKWLRRRLGLGKGKKGRAVGLGVIESKCLGLCPKGRIVAIDAARPDRWQLIEPRADEAALADALPSLSALRGADQA